jgi:hypothetical protein
MPLPNPNEVVGLNIPVAQRTLGGTVVRVGRAAGGGGGAVIQTRTGPGGARPGTAQATPPSGTSTQAQGTFGGGGGLAGARPTTGESGILSRLEGHVFSVRMRLTPER